MLQLARTVSDMSTMTQALSPAHATRHDLPASRPRLVSGRFAAALLSSFGALTSFYLLLSVTPMYAMSAGAGSAGAGLVTGSLMLTTVLAEFASPRLLGRFGYRAVFAAGALLLGGPAPALLLPHSMATIVAVSIARGIGFGLATVVLGALVAASVPAEAPRRGDRPGRGGGVRARDRGPAVRGLAGPEHRVRGRHRDHGHQRAGPAGGGPLAGRPGGAERDRAPTRRPAGQPALRRHAAARPGLRGHDRVGRRGGLVPAAGGGRVRGRRHARAVRAGRDRHRQPLVGRPPR